MNTVNIIQLHGFASSPASSKAAYFREKLLQKDIHLRVPDLNVPDFEHLTLTAMIERTTQEIAACPPGEVVLIGSSMGGAVAMHTFDRKPETAQRVHKMVLLAPAIDFRANRLNQMGEAGLQRWKESRWLEVEHYAYNEKRQIHYGLIEDLEQYDGYSVTIDIPILLIHGTHDESVNYRGSVRFAES
ncbi:MAG TPA: YqiA/YcfP family alpha/beta fold hydrolase, partial [Aggregatilineales bacterium]|nr:YqiA/YcfP family alpha/beta fold hydrolase [Aggregatilineales bacterium]